MTTEENRPETAIQQQGLCHAAFCLRPSQGFQLGKPVLIVSDEYESEAMKAFFSVGICELSDTIEIVRPGQPTEKVGVEYTGLVLTRERRNVTEAPRGKLTQWEVVAAKGEVHTFYAIDGRDEI